MCVTALMLLLYTWAGDQYLHPDRAGSWLWKLERCWDSRLRARMWKDEHLRKLIGNYLVIHFKDKSRYRILNNDRCGLNIVKIGEMVAGKISVYLWNATTNLILTSACQVIDVLSLDNPVVSQTLMKVWLKSHEQLFHISYFPGEHFCHMKTFKK